MAFMLKMMEENPDLKADYQKKIEFRTKQLDLTKKGVGTIIDYAEGIVDKMETQLQTIKGNCHHRRLQVVFLFA